MLKNKMSKSVHTKKKKNRKDNNDDDQIEDEEEQEEEEKEENEVSDADEDDTQDENASNIDDDDDDNNLGSISSTLYDLQSVIVIDTMMLAALTSPMGLHYCLLQPYQPSLEQVQR